MSTDWIVLYVTVLLALGWAALYFGRADWRDTREARARWERDRQNVNVLLNGGYHPERIVLRRGRPIRLHITRTDEGESAWIDFEFPYAGIVRELPEGETVTIDVGPLESGEYALFADMGSMRGTLVVEDEKDRSTS